MKDFLTFFLIQTLSYGLVDCSYRFVAQANIPLAVSSGMVYACVAFLVIRKIAKHEARGIWGICGYVAGSGLGTAVGIASSVWISGK